MSERPTFAPLPARVIGDDTLSATDIRVLGAVAVHDRLGKNKRGCYASHRRLSLMAGCHLKSLSRSLKALAHAGYLEACENPFDKRQRGYRVVYTDADKAITSAAKKGRDAVTEQTEVGNCTATETAEIGSDLVPDQPNLGNRSFQETSLNQKVADDNRSCETLGRDAVKLEKNSIGNGLNLRSTYAERMEIARQSLSIGQRLGRIKGLVSRTESDGIAGDDLLALMEAQEFCMSVADGLDPSDKLAGWAYDLESRIGCLLAGEV